MAWSLLLGGLSAAAMAALRMAVIHGLPAAVRALSEGGKAVGRHLLKSPTRLGLYATAAAPTAVKVGTMVTEHETSGGISDALFDASKATLEKLMDGGEIDIGNLEQYIDKAAYIGAVLNAFNKGAQNQAVRIALGDDVNNPNIEAGKAAAVSWLLTPSNMNVLAAKNLLRAGMVDKIIPDRNAADRYMAEKFVKDIVYYARANSLGDNQVSEEDVKKQIKKLYNDPNSQFGQFLRNNRRVANGLLQLWPDLKEEKKPAAEGEAKTEEKRKAKTKPVIDPDQMPGAGMAQILELKHRVESLKGKGLSSEFNRVTERDHLHMFSSVGMFMAKVLSFFGNPGGLADFFMRAVVVEQETLNIAKKFNTKARHDNEDADAAPAPAAQTRMRFEPGS